MFVMDREWDLGLNISEIQMQYNSDPRLPLHVPENDRSGGVGVGMRRTSLP